MKTITLDAKMMKDDETTLDYICEKLHLRREDITSIDDLWDALSFYRMKIEINIVSPSYIFKNLGGFGEDLYQMFNEINQEDGNVFTNLIY